MPLMGVFSNPAGSPSITFNGPTVYTQQQVAEACRTFAPSLKLPKGCGLNPEQLLWAFAGNESSFGADCRPRHERAYCTGTYSKSDLDVSGTKAYGHLAHCSYGPFQLLWVNVGMQASPEQIFANADLCAAQVVMFFNREILGRQKATTLAEMGDAYNSGNWRDHIIPMDYIAKLQHNYDHVLMPPASAVTIHAAGSDAQDVYQDFVDAIEGLGGGFHFAPFRGVPIDVDVAGSKHGITGASVQWINDEHGKRIDSITLTTV